MFDPARRFRFLAALGFILALAQGRAWSQEPIWTTAEDLLRLIRELPCIIGQTTATEQPQCQPLFAWDTPDEIGWHRGMAEFYEQLGEPHAAYQHYKCLSRRFPGQQDFVDAVERQRDQLWQLVRRPAEPYFEMADSEHHFVMANDADLPLLNPREDGADKSPVIEPMSALPGATPNSDARVKDYPLPLPPGEVPTGSALFDTRPIGSAVPVTPNTSTLLPDCERIRLLQEWGLIPVPAASLPVEPHRHPREGWEPGLGIIF